MTIGVNISVNGGLSFHVGPVISWDLSRVYPASRPMSADPGSRYPCDPQEDKQCSGKIHWPVSKVVEIPLTRCLTAVILSTWQDGTLIWWCLTAMTLINRVYALIWWCFLPTGTADRRTQQIDTDDDLMSVMSFFLKYYVLWNVLFV